MSDPVRINDTCGMIVQLPLTGFWGTDEELDSSDLLAEVMEELLQRHGCGRFDGTDCGSGTRNLFIYEIRDQDWDRALDLVLEELRRRGLANQALIAKSVLVGPEEGPWAEHSVAWPKDFRGEFSVLG
jgi:hypothetical protein